MHKGPWPKVDRELLRRFKSEDWLKRKLADIEQLIASGQLKPASARTRRYMVRLRAQCKCVRCRRLHIGGTYYCTLCKGPRRLITNKYRRSTIAKLKAEVTALEQQLKEAVNADRSR